MSLYASRREIASRIANGHAYDKHVDETSPDNKKDLNEFEDLGIRSREDFEAHINSVLDKDDVLVQSGANDRAFVYDADTNTAVVINPGADDYGTCYRPRLEELSIEDFYQKEVRDRGAIDVRASGLPDYDRALESAKKESLDSSESSEALAEMDTFLRETEPQETKKPDAPDKASDAGNKSSKDEDESYEK